MKGSVLFHLSTLALCTLIACSGSSTGAPEAPDANSTDLSTTDSTPTPNDNQRPHPDTETEPATGLSTQSMVHDGVTREYALYVPTSYDGSTELPLLLNFHGFDMGAEGQMSLADMRGLADEQGFILVYPEGTLDDDDATHWNTMLPSGGGKSTADDFGFVAAMLDDLVVNFAIDESRVYATGYSNGGGFTYSLACHLSDKIAAIAPVSGLMWHQTEENCAPTHPTALIIVNGTADTVRPYEGIDGWMLSVSATMDYWKDHNNITTHPDTTTIGGNGKTIKKYLFEGGTNGVSIVHYKILGGGHDWFNQDFNGSDINSLIWDFLSQFDINGLR